MPVTLVDTNVLIDIATEDPRWGQWSADRLSDALQNGSLATNVVIYAEFSVYFEAIEDVERALSALAIKRLPIPYEAAFVAGKVFRRYRARGGTRSAPLPDFFIGAHAAVAGLRLLTRDGRRYRQYFSGIELIAPRGRRAH